MSESLATAGGSALAAALLRRYRDLGAERPSPVWAAGFPASIPFIGGEFGVAGDPKVLVYASAENLNSAPDDDSRFHHPELALNRHRVAFDRSVDEPAGPEVGIAPFDRGGLLVGAALLRSWIDGREFADRHTFTETVAVGNLSKFSVKNAEGRANVDVGDLHLRDSLKFVAADLEVLRPNWVILAKPADATIIVPVTRAATLVGARVIPMYQFHARPACACGAACRQEPSMGDDDAAVDAAVKRLQGAFGVSRRGDADWFRLLRRRFLAARAFS